MFSVILAHRNTTGRRVVISEKEGPFVQILATPHGVQLSGPTVLLAAWRHLVPCCAVNPPGVRMVGRPATPMEIIHTDFDRCEQANLPRHSPEPHRDVSRDALLETMTRHAPRTMIEHIKRPVASVSGVQRLSLPNKMLFSITKALIQETIMREISSYGLVMARGISRVLTDGILEFQRNLRKRERICPGNLFTNLFPFNEHPEAWPRASLRAMSHCAGFATTLRNRFFNIHMEMMVRNVNRSLLRKAMEPSAMNLDLEALRSVPELVGNSSSITLRETTSKDP